MFCERTRQVKTNNMTALFIFNNNYKHCLSLMQRKTILRLIELCDVVSVCVLLYIIKRKGAKCFQLSLMSSYDSSNRILPSYSTGKKLQERPNWSIDSLRKQRLDTSISTALSPQKSRTFYGCSTCNSENI